MPIRASEKARYPNDWPQISLAIRERAGQKCEECRVRNYALGGRSPDGRFWPASPNGESSLGLSWPEPGEFARCSGWPHPLRIIRIILTVAHLDHTPENNDPANLRALCQRCHIRYDAKMKAAGRKQRAREQNAIADFMEPPHAE